MAYKYPFSILLALILYSVAQTQASPSVDDLYYSIKASRDEIVSGSMTYLYSEEDYGGPNISVNSDMDRKNPPTFLQEERRRRFCSFEFKRQGGLMLWRLSVKNQADNRDVRPMSSGDLTWIIDLSIPSTGKRIIVFQIRLHRRRSCIFQRARYLLALGRIFLRRQVFHGVSKVMSDLRILKTESTSMPFRNRRTITLISI